MTGPSRSQRRLLALRILSSLAVGGLAVVLFALGWEVAGGIAGILSGFATILTLYSHLGDRLRMKDTSPRLDEAAEDLRMRLLEQWEPEVRQRVQRTPHSQTIPLEWKEHGRSSNGPSPLDGRFEGDPDEAAEQLADKFHQLPGKKRMVVLGEPGAGKTFFAIALVAGLLRKWTEGSPVAVFLPLSSWDPVVESLDDWIVGSIASSHYVGERRTPRTLLTGGRLIPVIDGLDELPEHLRRTAVERINRTLIGDRPLVITCRTTEYQELLTGGAPALLRAPAVEVQPVTTTDLVARLEEAPAWQNVVRRIEDHPAGQVASALRTPLMLSFFTTVYQNRDPDELLDEKKFATKHAVEDHLAGLRLDTAYPDEAPSGQWSARRAMRWLTYLAQHMHDHGERSITWWRLADRAVSTAEMVTLAVVVWLIIWGLASSTAARLPGFDLWLPLILGAIGTSMWLTRQREAPGQARTRPISPARVFGRGMTIGFIMVLAPGLTQALVSPDTKLMSYEGLVQRSVIACAALALALVYGSAVGLHELMVERSTTKHSARAARDLLRLERRSAFVAAGPAGLIAGVASVFAATGAMPVGGLLGQRLASAFKEDTIHDMRLPPWSTYVPWPVQPDGLAKAGLLVGILFALVLATTRAWPRLLMARVMLACTGQLPWRLTRFITDATRRGLLRRDGIAYEFGHVLLQDRLVLAAVDHQPLRRRPWLKGAVIGTTGLLALSVTGAALSGAPANCTSEEKAGIAGHVVRIKTPQSTACFAHVDERDWKMIERTPANGQLLASMKVQAPKPADMPTYPYTVSIIGQFNGIHLHTSEWHSVLVGLAAAQQVGKNLNHFDFIYADLTKKGEEAADLIKSYLQKGMYRKKSTKNTRDFTVVGLDIAWSQLVKDDDEYQTFEIVGMRDPDLYEGEKRGERVVFDWIGNSLTSPTPPTCRDGAQIQDQRMIVDLRKTQLSEPALRDLATCGGVRVLVNKANAADLQRLPNRPQDVHIYYLNDQSATIRQECEQAVGTTKPDDTSLRSCVAVVSAYESFRVRVERLAPPEQR